ncbi:MAG: ABC transporter ATP-binding protein [Lachnospiraceae bacterium]|nr:ABC transporter ATP-binding protein [Lachnospiraceae bacterium]
MIGALKKIWQFAGKETVNINKSVVFCLIHAICNMFQIGAIYVIVQALIQGETGMKPAVMAFIFMAINCIGGAIIKNFSQLEQTHAGYFMVADKRVAIGNKLKSIPMGYFNENNLGEITGVTTTVLDNVENMAPVILVNILSGFINALVFTAMVVAFDGRVGLLVVVGTIIYLMITSSMEKKATVIAPKRQESEAKLVGAILEYVQGMSVIKSFNLTGKGDQRVRTAVEENRKSNLNMEKLFTPYVIAQGMTLQVFEVGMMVMAIAFFQQGNMVLADALMVIIMSFFIFTQIQSAGSGMAILRVCSSCIEHANEMDDVPQMDEKGKDIVPKNNDITLEHVNFSYEKKQILKDVSLTIPSKTTTAIIGPSGSGKTTLCNLIARFWDVNAGSVKVGGHDVKEYTLEALTDQISMVFQNVYLFADTIENNIKFGRPNATHEEVVEAAKKACCHDFIEALPDGYQTVIGEGGASLSGGEKQRISIARAMLKDAPIVILDEATANVDPENEDKLQKAIEELTRNKTIIMIAHRLKTVRNADQILVVDDGQIVQKGTHDELIKQKGIYANFVNRRKDAISWKLGA